MNKEFVCGKCVFNDDGFCDYIGVFVEEDDSPHCSYGKGWTSMENFKRQIIEISRKGENDGSSV